MLLPELAGNQYRLAFLFDRVIEEATDATTDTHWWEVALDLIAKAANGCGETGRAIIEATQRVPPAATAIGTIRQNKPARDHRPDGDGHLLAQRHLDLLPISHYAVPD